MNVAGTSIRSEAPSEEVCPIRPGRVDAGFGDHVENSRVMTREQAGMNLWSSWHAEPAGFAYESHLSLVFRGLAAGTKHEGIAPTCFGERGRCF